MSASVERPSRNQWKSSLCGKLLSDNHAEWLCPPGGWNVWHLPACWHTQELTDGFVCQQHSVHQWLNDCFNIVPYMWPWDSLIQRPSDNPSPSSFHFKHAVFVLLHDVTKGPCFFFPLPNMWNIQQGIIKHCYNGRLQPDGLISCVVWIYHYVRPLRCSLEWKLKIWALV